MITEKEEQSLKMYALKILSSITKKLYLYIEVDKSKHKLQKSKTSVSDLKEDDDLNESHISQALEKL